MRYEFSMARESIDEQLLSLLQRGAECRVMMIGAYFDESGKFKDHSTVSLAAVASMPMDFNPFGETWHRELFRAGLKTLTMKEALNVELPLSKKRPAKGIAKRIEALMPFVECIRKHLQLVSCAAMDTIAFKQLPSDDQKLFGGNPHYVAFVKLLLDIFDAVKDEDTLTVVCDDDEETALQIYKLYRKIKLGWRDARHRLVAISFANDDFFHPLQAADMIASLCRLEAKKQIHGDENLYQTLYDALSKPKEDDRLWAFNPAIMRKEGLTEIALAFADAKRKQGADVALLEAQLF
jgi:hypothetical protein